MLKCDIIVNLCFFVCLISLPDGTTTRIKTGIRRYSGKYVGTRTHRLSAEKRSYNRRRDKRLKRWGIDIDVGCYFYYISTCRLANSFMFVLMQKRARSLLSTYHFLEP